MDNIQRIYDADFSVIVYNFLDILSHARTETDIIRELTEDEASFRFADALVVRTPDLFTLLRLLSKRGHTVIITSDHGTIRVDNPIRVTGDRETSPNLRYKTGRNLSYNPREVYEITRPEDIQLPRINPRRAISSPTTPIFSSITMTPTASSATTRTRSSTAAFRWRR